jgi:beta-1,4-mannosyl-glycoprotein beta-1,4-N-acetylglucosaminyltransferase
MFNDELDLLDIRMNLLYPFVEKFVIVESDRTHSGLPKDLVFLKNQNRFKKFSSKIMHLQYIGGEVANGTNAWGNENGQRNKILEALIIAKPSDSLLFISDADEIPKPEKLIEAKCICCRTGNPVVLNLFNCMYYFNLASDVPYKGAYLYNPEKAKDFQARFGNTLFFPTDIRWHASAVGYESDFISIDAAGWHFSTVGGIDRIREKISSYAHLEFNTEEIKSEENLIRCREAGIPYFDKFFKFQENPLRFSRRDISFLPEYVQLNQDRFRQYIL